MDEFEDGRGDAPESYRRGGSGGNGGENGDEEEEAGGSGAVTSSPQSLRLQRDVWDAESVVIWRAMSVMSSEVLAKRLSFQ